MFHVPVIQMRFIIVRQFVIIVPLMNIRWILDLLLSIDY